jgi:hypothetical protein
MEVSNRDFLRAIFGEAYSRAHVAGFAEDPGALDREGKRGYWGGGAYGHYPERRLAPENNTFYCISAFRKADDGRWRRRKELHDATYVFGIDDVGTKLSADDLFALGAPPPTYVLETSPDNFQWGYKLTEPETDALKVEALQDSLVAAGLTEGSKDPGMKGRTRYLRLPVGTNTKAKYRNGKGSPKHRLVEWQPEITYTIEELAEAMGLSLDVRSGDGVYHTLPDGPEADERAGIIDPLWDSLERQGLVKGRLKPGVWDITCPNVHEHTGQEDTGTAYMVASKQIVCHHGHCAELTRGDYSKALQSVDDEFGIAMDPLPPESKLRIITPGLDWRGKEPAPRQWIVEDWIPNRQVTALYGAGGLGKTLLAQQLGTAVATGKSWLGLPTVQGPVLALFCEDDEDELLRRQLSINAELLCDHPDQFHIICRPGKENALMEFRPDGSHQLTPLWQELARLIKELRPRLVQLDTLADIFAGNENDRQQARRFIQQALTRLALKYDCAVLLCAHPSKSGLASGDGSSGSTGWTNSVRSHLYVSAVEGCSGGRTLTRLKSNYAAYGEQLALQYRGGVLVPGGVGPGGNVDPEEAARRTFLQLMEEAQRTGVQYSPHRQGHYAPREMQKIAVARHWTSSVKSLEIAMQQLIDEGVVQRITNNRNRSTVLELVDLFS